MEGEAKSQQGIGFKSQLSGSCNTNRQVIQCYWTYANKSRGLYHETLQIHNLWKMDRFCSKL